MWLTAEAIRSNQWIPHCPTLKQLRFIAAPHREKLYGGAAGGGKSDALLMDALLYVDDPGYSAILFRRTYADLALPGALMDRAHDWLGGTAAKWNEQTKTYTFPSGATLTFGYLEHENQKFRYQGAEFQYIGFDETTQFTETQYRYLRSRLRRGASMRVPLRMAAASNPGGVGHQWVYEWFVAPKERDALNRLFVPAALDDNPYLDRDEYRRALEELDDVTRDQLLKGLWVTDESTHPFKREWWSKGQNRYDPSDRSLINKTIARFAALDTAAKSKETNAYTALVVGELLPDYRLLIRYVARGRITFDALPDWVVEQLYPYTHDFKFKRLLIEDASSGIQLLQVFGASGPEWVRTTMGPVKPIGKEETWQAASVWCRRGTVWLPHPTDDVPWLHDFENEIFNVPDTRFLDQADAFSMLVTYTENQHYALSTRWRALMAG